MNVKRPRKTSISPQRTNQYNIPEFLKLPPPEVNLIPKEHVGVNQNNQLQFNQTNDRMFSPISEKHYLNISIDQDDFILPIWQSNINEDLFDNPVLTDNTELKSNITEKLANSPPAVTYSKVQDKINSGGNSEDLLHTGIRLIPTEDHDQITLSSAIESHPLTPIIKKWVSQRGGTKDTHYGYKSKLNKFIIFLIDLNIKYPNNFHLLLYKHALKNSDFKDITDYISTVRSFFKWAKANGYYKDISKETYDIRSRK